MVEVGGRWLVGAHPTPPHSTYATYAPNSYTQYTQLHPTPPHTSTPTTKVGPYTDAESLSNSTNPLSYLNQIDSLSYVTDPRPGAAVHGRRGLQEDGALVPLHPRPRVRGPPRGAWRQPNGARGHLHQHDHAG